ncbi:MAG: NADH-quinone oxidoreductase subunit NuoE [Candidatus Thermoplasmatota archaeon]|nr:NADH-quinone oxidoreductase subunit NuoE [Candidatus Thermoplasmatota archaeon]
MVERSKLIPRLQKIQEKNGYLPEAEIVSLAEELGIPLSSIYGVATFYTQFRFQPLGKYVLKICHGTACHVNGAVKMSEVITEVLGIDEGQTTPDGLVTVERVACLGCCSLSPVIMINDRVFGKLDTAKLRDILDKLKRGEIDD